MANMKEFRYSGELLKDMDLTTPNKRWQHPWLLIHRVALHDQLKKVATGDDGPGIPAKLHTSTKAVDFDAELGTVAFENGTSITADVIVGADGIYVSAVHRCLGRCD
jgi:2-polyprenyl-6-methoxyphenol hydroxylase-like FAD-dependent oxidoreductase